MTILDAHCDAPSQMLRGRDFGKDNAGVQVDFPKMLRGGVDASFFALYIPASLRGSDATSHALALLDALKRQVAENPDKAAFAVSASEVEKNKVNGLISILIGIENASALQEDLTLLEKFYDAGVRYITLTHSEDNLVGDSCTGSGRWGGLSPFGRKLVREMNEIGMLIDLAHSADSTISDVLDISTRPVVYTHGCCRSLCSHPRNLSDSLIRGVAESGGVVGMSIYPCFLWDEFKDENCTLPRPGIDRVVEHIRHAVSVAGIGHVGLGTDYDGIDVTAAGLEDISRFPALIRALGDSGLSEDELSAVSGGNYLRLLTS